MLDNSSNNWRKKKELFAGNIGTVQSVDTIIEAARILKDERKNHFHIVGSGTELEHLKELAKDVPNVLFYGRKPVEEMPQYYAMADAMLITLKADEVLSLTLPGKVQSYMASGKPIIGAIDGEAKSVIRDAECGFVGSAESANELSNNILTFINSREKRKMGLNALNYYNNHFYKAVFVDRLENYLAEKAGTF